jgi:hypothetical protein
MCDVNILGTRIEALVSFSQNWGMTVAEVGWHWVCAAFGPSTDPTTVLVGEGC